ncbi:MAG: hypothetical protein KDN20_03170 [Verrucomicrobiae bacterium]|nr:hypothetical protein [Verrucomicrobiae bacterium]
MKNLLKLLALLSLLVLVTVSSMTIHPDAQRKAEIVMRITLGVFLASVTGALWLSKKGK